MGIEEEKKLATQIRLLAHAIEKVFHYRSQATRVYACINSHKIDEIMKMHGGLNGFDKPSVIFAVG